MANRQGVYLLILAAFIVVGGAAWYLGRGGVDTEVLVSPRLETDTQPWVVEEEEIDEPSAPPAPAAEAE